ncbi:uncharacterized protein LOC129875837 [Solanum dulcamara]|uniref:uncharacterized protein LOC129875837 n=1 Tax=Solanum dulcamara TaxID=45834 RepID=UPI0024852ECD|nr:uncharacterized protein LOC129875837 [Solanum dulcamara]
MANTAEVEFGSLETGKSKLGFVDDRFPKSQFAPEYFDIWEKCNAVILSWIMNVLHKEIHSLSQGTMSVTDYYTTLKSLWNKFDSSMPCTGCLCDESKKFKEHCEYQRLLQFLMGLNKSHSAAKVQILLQTPTPNLNKAFSLIIGHKSQMNIENTSLDISLPRVVESTTLFSQKGGGATTHGGNGFGH